jgi:hypothetical protein
MGRKGVSKRKPNQNKSKPLSGGPASGSASAALKAVENQPLRTSEPSKPAADRKNTTRKG